MNFYYAKTGQSLLVALLNTKNAKQFGIGDLLLSSIDIYNSSNYYGVQMIFDTECFK